MLSSKCAKLESPFVSGAVDIGSGVGNIGSGVGDIGSGAGDFGSDVGDIGSGARSVPSDAKSDGEHDGSNDEDDIASGIGAGEIGSVAGIESGDVRTGLGDVSSCGSIPNGVVGDCNDDNVSDATIPWPEGNNGTEAG